MAVTQETQVLRARPTEQIADWFSQFGTVLVMVLLIAVFGLTAEHFLKVQNFQNILRQVSITSVLAIGMTMAILIGGIDLSVGSVVLFSASGDQTATGEAVPVAGSTR